MTQSQLCKLYKKSKPEIISAYLPFFDKLLPQFEVNTDQRQAGYFSQVGHESRQLRSIVENLNYSANGLVETWPNKFTKQTAALYARNPEAIANRAYANRMGNGDIASGDGWKYRGRGLIQLTGKLAYMQYSHDIYGDDRCVDNPDMLLHPEEAVLSSLWFWRSRGLNKYCDRGDIIGLTKAINGGLNGLADRQQLYSQALVLITTHTN